MAGTRILSEFTYRSGVPDQQYRFTIKVDEQGLISVRDVWGPFGLIIDSFTSVPQSVHDDIQDAIASVENILASTSAVNGTLSFVDATSASFTFSTPFANADYRVVLSPDVFTSFRITSKTINGFTLEASAAITADVGFDVFV